MELFVAGIIHYDPLGRHRIRSWLTKLLEQHDVPPGFVAVEWDKDHLARVVAQRPRLAELVREHWTGASAEYIQELADTAGYEGDSHLQQLPTVEIIWLDQGRNADEEEIEGFAKLRFGKYKLLATRLQIFDAKALNHMSEVAWSTIPPRVDGTTPRDEKFAESLFVALKSRKSNWAIAILGMSHASDAAGSTIDLLRHNGITCHVTKMNPNYNSA